MTEDLNKGLEKCPFCAAGETIIHENKGVWLGTKGYAEALSFEVQHWCEQFGGMSSRILSFVGKTKEDAIARWNTRAVTAREEKLIAALKNAHDELEYDPGNGVAVKDDIAQALKELGITEERKDD